MTRIIVTKRIGDYHACIEGRSEIWGCGKTPNEAIGDLVRSHPDTFSIDVEVQS